MSTAIQSVISFLEAWQETDEENKKAFVRLLAYIEGKDDTRLEFIPRPGVSHSLRAANLYQKERSLFVLVDVIEAEPRWLSVCFYHDMVTDPKEHGDFLPKGLMEEDAVCFHLSAYDETLLAYLESRMDEAHQASYD